MELDSTMIEYRQHLVLAKQEAQADYDKTLIKLASGALGISFAFVDQFIPTEQAVGGVILLLSWSCWVGSLSTILCSFLFSRYAIDGFIAQVDAGKGREKRKAGFSRATEICNIGSGILFLSGLVLVIVFVGMNLTAKPIEPECNIQAHFTEQVDDKGGRRDEGLIPAPPSPSGKPNTPKPPSGDK